jgi:hypothetical protein
MLARRDKPLRLSGAVKTAKAKIGGRTIVAIAPEQEPWLAAFNAGGEAMFVEMMGGQPPERI